MATIGNAPVFPTESVLPGNLEVTGNATISGSSATVNGDEVRTLGTSGAIVQVVSSMGSVTDTTSTSANLSLHTQAITPTSSSNKILVIASLTSERVSASVAHYYWGNLYRDSTNILNHFGNAMNFKSDESERSHCAATYLDSPATTSSVTYKIEGDFSAGGGSRFVVAFPILTLLEVVA